MPENLPERSNWWWLRHYPVLNLRFILRCYSFTTTFLICLLLLVEIFRPVDDYTKDGVFLQSNSFGGTECSQYVNHLRVPGEMWHVYLKIQSSILSLWLLSRISVLFFPLLFCSNWLYQKQEKLKTYRTNILIISGATLWPLLFLCNLGCLFASYYVLVLAIGVFVALLMDRIFIRENDYYLLQVNDDVDLIPMNHWEKESKKKREGPSVAAT